MASTRSVTLYSAAECGLCERAEEVVREVCGDEFELVRIEGEPELEDRYRAFLPVLEIDGERAFTYFVDADALRLRLSPG